MVSLRKYQEKCVRNVLDEWKEHDRVLTVSATGTGKTIMFGYIAHNFIKMGLNVLIIAHRGELLSQAQDKLKNIFEMDSYLEKGEDSINMEEIPKKGACVVASVQSLCKEDRLEKFGKKFFGIIIVDETHHIMADSYMKILDYFEKYKLLGVTATPSRSDQKSLSKFFDVKAFEYDLEDAIDDGWLADVVSMVTNISIDISKVRTVAGDYMVSELDDVIHKYLIPVAQFIKDKIPERKHIVVFTPRVASAEEMASILNKLGVMAEAISGKSSAENRSSVLESFNSGCTRVICNAALLTEGWDEEGVDCIINLRPTQSMTLFKQIIGRGTRPSRKKRNLLVVDFLWRLKKDKSMCNVTQLFAKSNETSDLMKNILIKKINKAYNLAKLSMLCNDIVIHSPGYEKARKDYLRWADKKPSKQNPYLVYCFIANVKELFDYEPTFQYELKPVTPKQKKYLEDFAGISTENMNLGLAQKLIGVIINNGKGDLPTPKQMFFLSRSGILDQIPRIKKKEASEIVSATINNKWKVPYSILKDYAGENRAFEELVIKDIDDKLKEMEDGIVELADSSIL